MPSQTVSGLADLERALKELDEKVAKKAMRNAVAAGGRVFRDLMKAKAPRDKGDLASDIVITTRADVRNGRFIAKIYPRKKPRKGKDKEVAAIYKALWLEFGVRPHYIQARGGKGARQLNKGVALALKLGASGAFVESVDHPGIAPHPFMRPAADEGWPKALEVFKQKLNDAIREAQKK